MELNNVINGVLLIDKPAGWTSHDVVAKLRGTLKIKRIGHAGTLDPFATGLVVVGVGKATKQLESIMHQKKTYTATITLGATSSTFDSEGEILPQTPTIVGGPDIHKVENALNQFRGGYEQKAPLFSAKHINGKRLYDLARDGKATEDMRPIKQVQINEITVLTYQYPLLTVRVTCGSGTYIRSLADDIGRALGVGGYCETLRRDAIGLFTAEQAMPPTAPVEQLMDNVREI